MKLFIKILLTILFLLFAIYLFINLPNKKIIEKHININEKVINYKNNDLTLYNLLVIFLFISSIWIWKNELKISTLGFISGDNINQQNVDEINKDKEADANIKKYNNSNENNRFKNELLDLFKNNYAINTLIVQKYLKVNFQKAKDLLYELIDENKIRMDGFPDNIIYTLNSSIENLIIDKIKDELKNNYNITDEKRFYKINNIIELDGLFAFDDYICIIEIKRNLNLNSIYLFLKKVKKISSLLNNTFKNKKINFILASAVKNKNEKAKKENYFNNLSIEPIKSITFQFKIYLEKELNK